MMKLRRKKYDTCLADDTGGGAEEEGGGPDKKEAKRRSVTAVGQEQAPATAIAAPHPPAAAADKKEDPKHKEKEKKHKEKEEKKHKEHKDPIEREKEKEAKHARKLLEKRMKNILKEPGNKLCSECRRHKPKWMALLQAPIDAERQQLGVLCCGDCEAYHEALGPELCILKSLKVPEDWTEEDLTTLEKSGNQVVNAIYQSALEGKHTDKHIGMLASKAFVESKYKHCQYFSEGTFHQQMELRKKLLADQNALNGEEEDKGPTTVDLVKQALNRQKKEAVPIEDKNAIEELAAEGTDRSVLAAMFSAQTVERVLGKDKDADVGVGAIKRPSLMRAASGGNVTEEPGGALGRRGVRRGSVSRPAEGHPPRGPPAGRGGRRDQLRRASSQIGLDPSGGPGRSSRTPRRALSSDGIQRTGSSRAGRRPTLANREQSFRNPKSSRPSLAAGAKSFRHRPTRTNSGESDGSHGHHHKGGSPPPEQERGLRRPTLAGAGGRRVSVRNLNAPPASGSPPPEQERGSRRPTLAGAGGRRVSVRNLNAHPASGSPPPEQERGSRRPTLAGAGGRRVSVRNLNAPPARKPMERVPTKEVDDNTTSWSRAPAKITKLQDHVAEGNHKRRTSGMRDHSEYSEAKSHSSSRSGGSRRRSGTKISLKGLVEMDPCDNNLPQYGWGGSTTNDRDQSGAASLGGSSRRSGGSREHKAIPKLKPNSADIPKHSSSRRSSKILSGSDLPEKSVPKLLPNSSDIPKHGSRRPSKFLEKIELPKSSDVPKHGSRPKRPSKNLDKLETTKALSHDDDNNTTTTDQSDKKSLNGDDSLGHLKKSSHHSLKNGSDDGSTTSASHHKGTASGDRSAGHHRRTTSSGDHSPSGSVQRRRRGDGSEKPKQSRGHHERARSPQGGRSIGNDPSSHSRSSAGGSPKPTKIVEDPHELEAGPSIDSDEFVKDITESTVEEADDDNKWTNSHLDGLDDGSDFDVDQSEVILSDDDTFAESGSSGDPKSEEGDDDAEIDYDENGDKAQSHQRREMASGLKGRDNKLQDDGSSISHRLRLQSSGQDTMKSPMKSPLKAGLHLDMGAALKKFATDEK